MMTKIKCIIAALFFTLLGTGLGVVESWLPYGATALGFSLVVVTLASCLTAFIFLLAAFGVFEEKESEND